MTTAKKNAVKKTLTKFKREYVALQTDITSNALTAKHIPMLKELKKKAAVLRNKAYNLELKINDDGHFPGHSVSTLSSARKAKKNGFEMAFESMEANTIWFNLVCFVDQLTEVIADLQVKYYMPDLKTLPKSFNA